MRLISAALITAAVFSFALGITLPLLEVKRLIFFSEKPSLLHIIAGLWDNGDWLLALAIAVFSVALPALKLVSVQYLAAAPAGKAARLPRAIGTLSKWSMLDVLLVALVIFAAKSSGLAIALTLPGLWFFAGSVVLTAIASLLVQAKPGR
ncbi:MAG: paraquat-inducible protein A [Rhizobiaceae bacterium]|nr:paraquat-inducible protein A [Rhizobiaceae bacterium]MBO6726655.1 paraquat-inducible protein A [Rhizobiaceae bacterium]